MADALEKSWKINQIMLDTNRVEGILPHASRLTPHASRLTPHASRLTPHAEQPITLTSPARFLKPRRFLLRTIISSVGAHGMRQQFILFSASSLSSLSKASSNEGGGDGFAFQRRFPV
jgi:hypothetical protein